MKVYIDIDETICITNGDRNQARDYSVAIPILENIQACNQYYDDGHEITYWTARGTGTGIDWSDVTIKQLKKWGVKYHEVKFGKPEYDLFIDDKAFNTKWWENEGRCIPEM